jgi:hypothetical protein
MRPNPMRRLLALVLPIAISVSAFGQQSFTYKDTSMIKPPAGAKVAIWEFEDMECPVCGYDAPIVRAAVRKYKIAYVRHDFPLTEIHVWSFDAAVDARYIQAKSPELAEQYRLAVFAAQAGISNKDDLHNFTAHFASAHGILWPFVVDPQGLLAAKVKEDRALGDRIAAVPHTPMVWVTTRRGAVEVQDIKQLYSTIDAAIASTAKQ